MPHHAMSSLSEVALPTTSNSPASTNTPSAGRSNSLSVTIADGGGDVPEARTISSADESVSYTPAGKPAAVSSYEDDSTLTPLSKMLAKVYLQGSY